MSGQGFDIGVWGEVLNIDTEKRKGKCLLRMKIDLNSFSHFCT